MINFITRFLVKILTEQEKLRKIKKRLTWYFTDKLFNYNHHPKKLTHKASKKVRLVHLNEQS